MEILSFSVSISAPISLLRVYSNQRTQAAGKMAIQIDTEPDITRGRGTHNVIPDAWPAGEINST